MKIFLIIALYSILSLTNAQEQYLKNFCASPVLLEYDRSAPYAGEDVGGFFTQYMAATPYYYSVFAEAFTTAGIVKDFKMSPGSDYLSRNQIPTSDDLKRINPDAFLKTNVTTIDSQTGEQLFLDEFNAEDYSPFITGTDFGDGQTRYMSVVVDVERPTGRPAKLWAKNLNFESGPAVSYEWQAENSCEYFAGSYYGVSCEQPLWNFCEGGRAISAGDPNWGFGSGNPQTNEVVSTPAGLSCDWYSDIAVSAGAQIEIVIYYNLGLGDSVKIYDGNTHNDASLLLSLGEGEGIEVVRTRSQEFNAVYSTEIEGAGYGFRAAFDTTDDPCFHTSADASNCRDSANGQCYTDLVCAGYNMEHTAPFLANFNYSTCCTGEWGPYCSLAADAVWWSNACHDSDYNLFYPENNVQKRSSYIPTSHGSGPTEEQVKRMMPFLDDVSQLKKTAVSFGKSNVISNNQLGAL